MAVKLLAGPFNCTLNSGVLAPTNSPPISSPVGLGVSEGEIDLVVLANGWLWLPGTGGMLATCTAGSEGRYQVPTGIMTMDGRFCDRSSEPLYNPGWWPAKKVVVQAATAYQYDDTRELRLDLITLAQQETGAAPNLVPFAFPYVKLVDRRLYFDPDYAARTSFKAESAGAITTEGPPNPFGSSPGIIHPGRSDTEAFVAELYPHGSRGIFYDTLTKAWSSPLFEIGMLCHRLLYATDFGVLVSIHTWVDDPLLNSPQKSSQVRVWSLEVNPTTVTTPEAIDGEALSGQIVTYQVRVTGDHDDPAEGELVDWSLAAGSAGVLLDLQSKTDAEGYARTRVQYDVGATGTTTLEASVSC